MTHDELLDTIGHWNWIEPEPLLKALRAVVELHKPIKWNIDLVCEYCTSLRDYSHAIVTYPCDTIEAIEKELK